jgi:hypothetical protein
MIGKEYTSLYTELLQGKKRSSRIIDGSRASAGMKIKRYETNIHMASNSAMCAIQKGLERLTRFYQKRYFKYHNSPRPVLAIGMFSV